MNRPSALRLFARGAVAILIAAAVVVCSTAAFAQHQWTTETECGVILHPSGTDLEYLADDGRWLTVSRPSQEFTFAGPWSLTFRRADNQRPHTVSGDGCVPPTTTEPPTTTTEGTTTSTSTTLVSSTTTSAPTTTQAATTTSTTASSSTTRSPSTTVPDDPSTTSSTPPTSAVPTTTTPGSTTSGSTDPPPSTDPTVSTPGSSTAPAAELPRTGLSDVALIAGLVLVSVGGGIVGVSRWRGRRT